MKIEKKTFYVIRDFVGFGVDEDGNEVFGKKDIIFWSGESSFEPSVPMVIELASEYHKKFFMEFIDKGPNLDDFAAISLDGFEEWKKNK